MFSLRSLFKKSSSKNKSGEQLDRTALPQHIAIIMDGNGRWAMKRGMPRNLGHREGSNNLRHIVNYCSNIGIKYLSVYAFSTENWKRPKSEVETLMSLLEEYLKKAESELRGKNVRIRVIGDTEKLSPAIRQEIDNVTRSTSKNNGMNLIIALNYGGRDEMINAIKNIAIDVKKGQLSVNDIGDDSIRSKLYAPDVPDPDLMIRTSGEQRISNFLLWQCAYTEFWYTKTLWPDFKDKEMEEALISYQKRNRRFGGV